MPGKAYLLLLLFGLSAMNQDVHSAVYKWVDEDGNVVYGDKPTPKSGADKIEIKDAPKQDALSKERREKQQKLLDVMQQERNEKIAAEQEEKEKKAEHEKKCAEIRKELKEMKEAGLLYEKTDDPYNPKIYSDEERQAEEKRYEDYLNKYC